MLQRAALTLICFCAALVAFGAPCVAQAQVIDSVDVRRLGKEAEIAIRFTSPVQYLRHAPLDFGPSLRIYARLTPTADQDTDFRRETRRLPETDLVPRFTLSYPEVDGSLSITFDRPTSFKVREGENGKSIFVLVPVLPNAQDWGVQMKGAAPGAAQAAPQTRAPAAASARPEARATAGESRSIETIEVRRLGDQAEIRIRFTAPVRLAQPTPPGSGDVVKLYPQLVQAVQTPRMQGRETNRVEGIDLLPHFSLNYPESDGSLALRFDRATRYAVQPGPDDRSISIMVPALADAKDHSLYVQGAAPVPAMPGASPVTASAPAPAPALATPPQPVAASDTPAVAPTVAVAPAVAPAISTAPGGGATAPVALPALPGPAAGGEPRNAALSSAPAPAFAQVPAAELPALAPLTQDEIEARAKSALEEGQRALASRRGVMAADRLSLVLALPPNSQTRLAQALMGEAREYSGELRKAKAEYELYLKRYPAGAEAAQVKERLAVLNKSLSQASAPGPGGTGLAKPAEWTVYGSISQYSYRGNSQIETITPPPPGQLTFNSDKLSLQDQNAIISTLDLNARKRDGVRDTRIVIRDTDTHNFLYGQPQVNRLYSAYFEQSDKEVGYLLRAGRQLGSGGGVMGRFDGVWAGYNLNPTWRINGVAGAPVEFGTPLTRSVRGASIDRIPQLGEPGLSAYYVEQSLEGVNDRKAIGAEGRYFDQKRTAYAMVDYDLNFRKLNILMAQGNWRSDDGTSYFANADIRKTPPLGLLTAMPAQQVIDPFTLLPVILDQRTAFSTAVYNLGLGELRSQASMLSATSRLYSVGFMRPVTPRWQLGADYRLANVTGTGDVGFMAAQPNSGASNVYSGTALGTNLALPNDTVVLNASLIDNPTSFGQSYNVSYVIPYNAWRFDAILRYYAQTDNQDQKQVRIAPTLKVIYRWRNSVSFELEAGNELMDETGPLREMHSRRRYFFGGYRWDFR